jgi:hypothetical protein
MSHFKIGYKNLIGGIEETFKIFRKYNRFAGQDSKLGTTKY